MVYSIQTGGWRYSGAISADGTMAVIANEKGWYDHIR